MPINIAQAIQDPNFKKQSLQTQLAALRKLGVSEEGVNAYQTKSAGASIGAPTEPSYDNDPANYDGNFTPTDIVKGMGRSFGQTARGALGLVSQKAADTLIPKDLVTFRNPAEARAGQLEQVAEFAAPVTKLPMVAKAGTLGKMALGGVLEGAKGYGLTKAHGGSNSQAATVGGIGAAGAVAAPAAEKLASILQKSRLKNFINILQPKNEQQMEEAYRLAARSADEGIAPAGSNYDQIFQNADAARKDSGGKVEQFIEQNAGGRVPTAPILEKIDAMAPGKLPGGQTPTTGRNLQRAFEGVREDAEKAMVGTVPQPANLPGDMPRPPASARQQIVNNASGESDASMEAINRLKSMKSQGQKYVIFDRAGNMRPILGADAVDQGMRLNKGETFGILKSDGTFENIADRGGKVPPRMPTPETEAEKFARWEKMGIKPPPSKIASPKRIPVPQDIPLKDAVGERRRLDSMLNYERAIPNSAQYVKGAADAYRGGINQAFPKFGAENLRDSELIAITEMVKRAKTLASMPKEASVAGAAGAGLVGRTSIPAMYGTRWFAATPQFQTLSAAGKLAASRILENGALASRWLAATGQAGINKGGQ